MPGSVTALVTEARITALGAGFDKPSWILSAPVERQ